MSIRREDGSVLLTALLVCLGTALIVAALACAFSLAEASRDVEVEGRRLLGKAEEGLACGLVLAESAWEPARLDVEEGLVVTLTPVPGASGRLLRAVATMRNSSTTCMVSGIVERGQDGVDLPQRAAAAAALDWDTNRTQPVVSIELDPPAAEENTEGGAPPVNVLVTVAGTSTASAHVFGDGVALEIGRTWRLDAGTAALAVADGEGRSVLAVPEGAEIRRFLSHEGNQELGPYAEMPVILVGTGLGPLDATGLGELYGVILAGSGGVDLEGTVLHGAVFTEGALRFGVAGQVVFNEGILDWARYRSITRVRLVPGTREEAFSGPDS